MAVKTRVILPYKSHMLVNAQAKFFIWIFHEKKKKARVNWLIYATF